MTSKENSIKALTGRLRRIITKHARIEELPIRTGTNVGLTAKEVHCLNAIGEQEGANVKQIGDMLDVTKSAASQMIGKLEKKGFTRKGKAVGNDKEILVSLTDAGWEAFQAHKEFHERHFTTLVDRLEAFPDTQIAVAAAILATVETTVDERIAELFTD
ncbi:MarR family transcriptional regulator [Pseudodesulfovibrio sp. JC047]|uniref:MarR family winged helix-turn-helix transcriptional regulator n=1 Tax=Pseudodesulfovibrio sp. JC047 TaxID=2683199 RepID=UPI0013D29252|nr:MarR family transcriptional regulator [Pseudodesulfovibrio sp. JC047]NDV18361.1 MarR family transcriptional regulator [Pseudodesulfovibrio sp. JC047]